jgi:hypothetical protein
LSLIVQNRVVGRTASRTGACFEAIALVQNGGSPLALWMSPVDSRTFSSMQAPDAATRESALPRSSDASIGFESSGPYWPRVARAVAMLVVAVAAHVWIVRAPRSLTPDVPILVPAFTNAVRLSSSDPIRTVANVEHPAVSSAATVSLRVDVVHALPSLALEGTVLRAMNADTELVPVATTGVVAANDVRPVDDTPPPELTSIPAPLPDVSEPATSAAALTRVAAPRTDSALAYLSRPTPHMPAVELPDPTADLRKQEQVVLEIVREYARAYERMDVRAAKAIRPSLDERALQKAFQQLDGQQLQLAGCGVSISGSDANARCRSNATYRPKVGSRVVHLTEREWTFNLSRGESGWQIVNTRIQ